MFGTGRSGRGTVFETVVGEELVEGMGRFEESVKRSVDLFSSALGLILISPLLLLIALAIKLDSRGACFLSRSAYRKIWKTLSHMEISIYACGFGQPWRNNRQE